MGNFFAELKRRHIYRVAAAYAVVAWVLLQIVNNVAPGLSLPNWAVTLVIVLLAVGFPIALIFAWIHQLAPADGTTRAAAGRLDWALMGALVVVIGLVSYQQIIASPGARTAQGVSAAPPSQPQLGSISIAVLPFANMSGDAGQEFFSDGMTEEITAALTKVQGWRVLGRTSAFAFKGQNKDLRSIGQALGATHLIEGSVRKAGNRVRITAQLVNAADDSHLWAENYDRDLTDVFAIQEEIATAIAASLQVPLGLKQGDTLVPNRIKDEAVYEQYLRAKALVRARGYERLVEATTLLEKVIAREPNYAPAWALLSLAYGNISYYHPAYSSGAIEELRPIVATTFPKAEAAAKRAMELDPRSPDAYVVSGVAQGMQWKISEGQALLSRALALDPNNADALYTNSIALADYGYIKQADAMVQRLLKLEPLVPIFNNLAAAIMWLDGRTDEAIAILKPLNPAVIGLGGPAGMLARIYAVQGRYREASEVLSTIPAGVYRPETVETAIRLLRAAPAPQSSQESLPSLGTLGWVYFHVGAADRVLDNYEANFSIHHWTSLYPLWGAPYASLRKTEHFKAFVRKIGYVDYWKTHGWPDLCRPVSADDFVCD